MSLPRYSQYRNSGDAWLGAIPRHWKVMPLRWVVSRNDGGVWGDEPDGNGDIAVLRSTDQTVRGEWQIHEPAFRKLSPSEARAGRLEEGDLLITKSSGSALHIGKTTLVTAEIAALNCCFSNFMQRLRFLPGFHPRLAWYLLNSAVARNQFDVYSNTTTGLANLSGGIIGRVAVPVPPAHEQLAIVDFLDAEIGKIDALAEEQEMLIALLEEKRQAVISHAVTKGLNCGARMKSSGFEWLGDVPAHWDVVRLKHVTSQITVGIVVEPSRYYVDAGVPALRSLNVTPGSISTDEMVFISHSANEALAKSKLFSGDLVAVRSGQPGTTAVIPDNFHGCNCIDLIIIRRPSHASSDYLCRYLNSDAARHQFAVGSGGAIQQHFNVETASNLVVPVPPLAEQETIVEHLNDRIERIDQLTAESVMSSRLLKERRIALISAAITGQIDVRKLAAVEMA